ncbi:MAG: HD domain-containing protein [Candidatus Scalinduaceae bacterium]
MNKRYYAHSLEDKPTDKWHLLDEHLKNTAELAKSFADAFGSGEWAYLAGLWHDLVKYSEGKPL